MTDYVSNLSLFLIGWLVSHVVVYFFVEVASQLLSLPSLQTDNIFVIICHLSSSKKLTLDIIMEIDTRHSIHITERAGLYHMSSENWQINRAKHV